MTVSITAPTEFQGAVLGELNRRKATVLETEVQGEWFTAELEVALNQMFQFSSQLRSLTQGKGEFAMEYKKHMPVLPSVQEEMSLKYKKERAEENK